ncbi:hypothetical protein BDV93DRAFT_544100 [Ceratobasidium sp. AG-I]|nr:hypothetical protein BDV93DRAFT_544100 [Ceratobasidium sp. AG-I]
MIAFTSPTLVAFASRALSASSGTRFEERIMYYACYQERELTLRVITEISRSSIQLVSEKLSLWLKPFLSPKLKSFETWDHMGRRPLCVTSLELAEFAGLLVQHCPLLETLVLPYGKSEIQTADGMRLSVFSENALTYQHLTHAQSLVSLTADRRVLNPAALPIIGRLPQLETLNLYACVFPDRLSITPNLASDLFLKLKHLFIEGSVFSELKELWRMKQLVQGLTSVSIHLESDTYSITLPPVFLDFGRTSPHIDTLTIKYPDTIFMKPHELRALSNLSLHTLTLSGLEFGSFASFCRILGESVPLLKRLRLLRWTLDIWELVEMSKLLELENLAVAINWSPTYLDCPGLEGSIQRCDKLRILECNPLPSIVSSDESKLQNISRFILGVGPNIRSAEPLPECKHGEGYQKLNDSIKDLRDASTRSHPPTRYTTI